MSSRIFILCHRGKRLETHAVIEFSAASVKETVHDLNVAYQVIFWQAPWSHLYELGTGSYPTT